MPIAKVNGAEIYYEEAGSGSPLILSPGGLQGVLSSYQPVSAKLSQAHRIITYDRRFGGQSNSPLVVQTWDLVCQDVIGLMDVLGIEKAHLGGGSFGAAIALGCAVRYPERVRAIVPSNIAGGVICEAYLAMKLFKSAEMAMTQGIKAVVDAFDPDDRFAPFTPERAQYVPQYRRMLEAMPPEDFAQVMRDTIYALFEGPYLTLGMSEKWLRGLRTPTLLMPGNNDIHPRRVAEQVHRLIPNARWAEVRPHAEEPDKYVHRVRQFLAEVEASGEDRRR
jgi:pimeloyl-ACP methyl ester carboxylesterase